MQPDPMSPPPPDTPPQQPPPQPQRPVPKLTREAWFDERAAKENPYAATLNNVAITFNEAIDEAGAANAEDRHRLKEVFGGEEPGPMLSAYMYDLWNANSRKEQLAEAKKFGEKSAELGDWKPENLRRFIDHQMDAMFGIQTPEIQAERAAKKAERENQSWLSKML